ncbi:LEG1H protein, partial [Mystacornis crossleyi]|nr:LEG1H protein [Mystacornis crossleyi]
FGIQALLVVTVTLSPVTAAAQSENDVTGEDIYPPLWDLAPENLLDFPVKDNKIVISAWNYQERLGVYKSLLNASAKYFSAFGLQNSGNILWGLPLQHGWQFRTDSSFSYAGIFHPLVINTSYLLIIVTGMNYYLAIIPFLGAEHKDDFCYNVKDCWSRMPKLMDDWKAFFEYLLSTEHKAVNSATFSSFKLDDALGLIWKAHITSIAYALPKFQDSLKYLSDPEANFGQDWASAVDFIAATHFCTDLPTTNIFQAFLPQRMLVEADVPPSISDFSPQQNKVLRSLRALHKANKLTGGLLLKLWRKAMSTEAGREIGRQLIEGLTSS